MVDLVGKIILKIALILIILIISLVLWCFLKAAYTSIKSPEQETFFYKFTMRYYNLLCKIYLIIAIIFIGALIKDIIVMLI